MSTDHRRRPRRPCGRLWTTVEASPAGADVQRGPVVPNPQALSLLPSVSINPTRRSIRREVPLRTRRARRSPRRRRTGGHHPRDPLLSNLRLQLQGDQLSVTGTDVELTIHAEVVVAGDADGVARGPGPADHRHRALPRAGRGRRGRRGRRGPHQLGTLAVHRAHPRRRGLPAPRRPHHRRRVASRARCSARPCARWCGRPADEAPADPHRRAAGGRGGGPAAGGHRLLPAGDAGSARHVVLGEARRCWCRPRAFSELVRVLRRRARSRCGSASATRPSRPARCSSTTRLIEGEFPNYRQLIPPATPTASRSDASRCSTPSAG